ncbi:MAG: hypothetical protein HQ521_17515, partial [Bacteroidetes bacterium]|nr:hypothetical protein [Bacteroidota bacterium]
MSNLFKKCIIELEDSLTLINDLIPEISIKPENSLLSPLTNDNFNYLESESLINKCDIVCQHYFNDKKPIIRVIHHFACSGGSLISKCIASMPNVYLLSEVHPYTNLHMNSINIKYMPADIASLAKYSDIPQQEKLAKQIFTRSIESTHKHLNEVGGTLVLREHTHADFCSDLDKHEVCAVVDALSDDFKVLSLISLRDPIDSYLSLTRNKWLHFAPQTFDEYCNRLLKFLESYPDSKIILYEDFVSKPKKTMLYICQLLQLQYSELFENLFD